MTIEKNFLIKIPAESSSAVLGLVSKAEAALERSRKLPPGDRTETSRFEALHAAIDQIAISALTNGAPYVQLSGSSEESSLGVSVLYKDLPSAENFPEEVAQWLKDEAVLVRLSLPHFPGPIRASESASSGPPPPARRWASDSPIPKEAVRERFDFLIRRGLEGAEGADAAIAPSGIANSILTETLREYVCRTAGTQPVLLPVRYRDGSYGPDFPLRSLDLATDASETQFEYSFSLMSMRHPDLDTKVDGAWFRNSQISKPRPAGITDRIAFETSTHQLQIIHAQGATLVHMYQTGFWPALVGFYRAVVHHLQEHPGTLCVIPWYFRDHDNSFVRGVPWSTK